MKKTNRIYYSSNFLLPYSLFIGLGISKLINTASYDAWISIIIGTIIGLLLNKFFSILPSKENKYLLLIVNVFLLFLGITSITKLISSVYLNKTSNLIVMIPLLILIIYSASKNNYTIFKTTSILNIIFAGFSLFAILSLICKVQIDYFKPIFMETNKNIILASLEYAIYSILPLSILPNFKKQYNSKIYFLSSAAILLLFVLVVGNLGIELSRVYRYPEYMIFKNIAVLNFIENIENILFFIWIISIFVLTAHSSMNIKNMFNMKVLIITLLLLVFIINNYIIKDYKCLEFILHNIHYIALSLLLIRFISKIIGKEKLKE